MVSLLGGSRSELYKRLQSFPYSEKGSYCFAAAVLLADLCVCLFVLSRVNYTEIDWKAYMQQAEGFLNGTHDYSALRGDTGPLVYPAGHAYIFSLLYLATNHGENISRAQSIFALLYMVHIALVFLIYLRSAKVPLYVMLLMSLTSYRIHSIFLLRMFNDCFAMTFLYAAVLLWLHSKWTCGTVLYSMALSVKMNILLFAPAVAAICLFQNGLLWSTLLAMLAFGIQILLAVPFLTANATGYWQGAFNFGRTFDHTWTVNWRFLSPDAFVDRRFHVALLACHFIVVVAFLYAKFLRKFGSVKRIVSFVLKGKTTKVKSQETLFLLAGVNFIGVMFSRSLHYQFYLWYYHTLPFLIWRTSFPIALKFLLFGAIELCWNTYPSTVASSSLLHICHILLLYGIFKGTTNEGKAKRT
ncbi:ALG3 protein [Trichuris suis]|nr:ALG3 protein [Trichuris suis]